MTHAPEGACMAMLMTTGSAAAGAAVPLVLRSQMDPTGNALTRPSVLAGLGLGVAGLGASWAVGNGTISAPVGSRSDFQMNAMLFGATALTTGLLSAFTPSSGQGFVTPSV